MLGLRLWRWSNFEQHWSLRLVSGGTLAFYFGCDRRWRCKQTPRSGDNKDWVLIWSRHRLSCHLMPYSSCLPVWGGGGRGGMLVQWWALKALIYLCLNHGDQRVFQIWNHLNVLVISFRFIWIPMLLVYEHYKYFHSYCVVIDFRRQNMT